MTPAKKLSNDIKHCLRQEHGLTLTQLADDNGWTLRDVSDVVRGIRFGYYGRGRDIAEKIKELTGLTPSPEDKQAA